MRIRSTLLAVVVAVGAVIGVVSCDKNSPPSPISPSPPPPSPPPPSRIELVAPQEIAPGESVQLTVNAIHSDGSVSNVTGQAQWTPVTSEILQVGSTGIAKGKKGGEVVVTARFSGRSASAPILVLPRGTFRLAGFIRESGIAIADVTVSLISGVGEGLTATSRIDGGYALYGVSGSTLIQAKKEGYVDSIQRLDVTAHRTFDFSVVLERARRDYSGTYTLTISAATTCPLPDEAKRRVYTATLTQDGPRLAVMLSGADFIVSDGHGGWCLSSGGKVPRIHPAPTYAAGRSVTLPMS